MKAQPWGKPDWKWDCLIENGGCGFGEVSAWIGWGGPLDSDGQGIKNK